MSHGFANKIVNSISITELGCYVLHTLVLLDSRELVSVYCPLFFFKNFTEFLQNDAVPSPSNGGEQRVVAQGKPVESKDSGE